MKLCGVILALIVASGCNQSQSAPTTTTVPETITHIPIGGTGTIRSGGPIALLSTTKDGYDEINDALAAKDKIGLRNLLMTRKAFTVKSGTRGLVIDSSWTLKRVRILDGDHKDAAGWLPFEFVK